MSNYLIIKAMLNKSIKFLIENKLVAVLMLVLFVGWGTINAPFNWDTGFLPSNPVAVDAIPDIGENQMGWSLTTRYRRPNYLPINNIITWHSRSKNHS
jgi:hypothetical protein